MGKKRKALERRQREDQRKRELSERRQEQKQMQSAFGETSASQLQRSHLQKERHYPLLIEHLIQHGSLPVDGDHPLAPLSRMNRVDCRDAVLFAHRLFRQIAAVCPQLFGAPCHDSGLTYAHVLMRVVSQWASVVREPAEWTPKRRSPHRNFEDLLQHLFAHYPTHPSLLAHLLSRETRADFVACYFLLAQGASLRSIDLPLPLTKKMCHLFHQAPKEVTLLQAFRWAQMTAYGASSGVIHAVLHSHVGEYVMEDEPFWLTVFQWVSNHWDGPSHQIGPAIDYIRNMKAQDDSFSMKGRTAESILRQMRSWYRMLGVARHIQWAALPASGFKPFEYLDEEAMALWQIQEVRNSIALFQEGYAQGHCVYSYLNRAASGHISIWSMTCTRGKEPKRALTIEVNNSARAIVQVRGKSNRESRPEEKQLLRLWAANNQLQERFY